jgi:hypothetical protein
MTPRTLLAQFHLYQGIAAGLDLWMIAYLQGVIIQISKIEARPRRSVIPESTVAERSATPTPGDSDSDPTPQG